MRIFAFEMAIRKLIYALSLLILTVSVPARLYGQDSTSVAAVPVDSAVIKADSLIRYAMKFIGTPYRLGAVGPKEYDCSSYVRKVYSGIGIDLPRYTWTQIKAGREVSRIQDLQKGDLVFFGKKRGVREIGHIGIVVNVDLEHSAFTFIHCGTASGVSIQRLSHPYFLMRYMAARRILDDFQE